MRRLALISILLGACDSGDWLGPLERGTREALGAWDMWSQDSVRPYEKPMPAAPEGTVPVARAPGYSASLEKWRILSPAQRAERGAIAYRRYCHHCHGSSGDGRTIVGESLNPRPPDLRSSLIQARPTRELYDRILGGTRNMIPLSDTMTSLEILLAIGHVRTLAEAPSKPFFTPKSTAPAAE